MGCGKSTARRDAVTKKHISSYTELYEEIAKGRKLVVYEDVVLDIVPIMSTHPGGVDIWDEVIGTISLNAILILGTEISKYIYGDARLGAKQAHTHTADAMEKMRTIAIGKVPTPYADRIYLKTAAKVSDHYWHFHSKSDAFPGYSIIQFRREGFKTAALLQGSWELCGKYFSVQKIIETHYSYILTTHNLDVFSQFNYRSVLAYTKTC